MKNVLTEVDVPVVHYKLPEGCNLRRVRWLFHLLSRTVIRVLDWNPVSYLPSNIGVGDFEGGGDGEGIEKCDHLQASMRVLARTIVTVLQGAGCLPGPLE